MHGGGTTAAPVSFPVRNPRHDGSQRSERADRNCRSAGYQKKARERRDYISPGADEAEETSAMSNRERIQARIERDKARKAEKKKIRAEEFGVLERVVTMQHLLESMKKRRKGTDWKGSVQSFVSHAVVKLKRLYDAFREGRFEVCQTVRMVVIRERGKLRVCRAVLFDTRVMQGVICDYCITPMTQPHLIYDNPASTVGKGVRFMRDRMMAHLRRAVRRVGPEKLCALVTDFVHFFDNIQHRRCRMELEKAGIESRLVDVVMRFVTMYHRQDFMRIPDEVERTRRLSVLDAEGEIGATLGSQISQDMALVIPNEVDHLAKDKLRMKTYCRFMDDGEALASKEDLLSFLPRFREAAEKVGFSLHESKTQIVPVMRGFTFLKVHYTVTETGKIVRKAVRSGIVRMRRKLKKLERRVQRKEIPKLYVFQSFASWYGMMQKIGTTYRQRREMLRRYNRLFDCYRLEVFAA